jgi:FAD/FMN-containing dehydrogenase
VLVDLGKRMNRILDVSEEDATVLLEPGVQYMTVRRGACLASHVASLISAAFPSSTNISITLDSEPSSGSMSLTYQLVQSWVTHWTVALVTLSMEIIGEAIVVS